MNQTTAPIGALFALAAFTATAMLLSYVAGCTAAVDGARVQRDRSLEERIEALEAATSRHHAQPHLIMPPARARR